MPDAGLLRHDSVARRVDRELFVLLGGTAALLLQVAHPLVAAGVDQHSDFRRAPLRRLRRTLDTTLAAVFGDTASARRALRRIDERHDTVVGTSADGRAYRARDPRLMLWVQTTLVLTSLRVYELVLGTLPTGARQRYWDEAKVVAAELGIPAELFPRTIGDLERYESEMLAGEVAPDATARRVAHDVLRPFGALPDPAYWPSDALTAGLLPAPLRQAFGLRFGTAERVFFHSVIAAVRMLRTMVPDRLAAVPQARAYDRRMRRAVR